jgi:hypothetical protein
MGIFDKIIRGRGGKSAPLYDESHDEYVSGDWWGARGTLAKFYEFVRVHFFETGELSKPNFDKVLRAVSEAVEAIKDDPQRINKTRNRIYQKRKLLKGLSNKHYLLYYYGVMCFIDSMKYYRETTEMNHPEEDIYMTFCKEQLSRHTFGVSNDIRLKFYHFCGLVRNLIDDDKEWVKRNK